ncbi:MAG: SRPBCC domain-containing protein [Anaerolineae bacterium]
MTNAHDDYSLVVERVFAAPRERVFKAWTEASALQRWFRPLGCAVTVTRLELRVGGEYQFTLHHPDGETSTISGRYMDIVQPERLVFTWVSGGTHFQETEVTVEFIEQGVQTEVRLTHSRLADDDMRQLHQNGWSCLEFLGDAL